MLKKPQDCTISQKLLGANVSLIFKENKEMAIIQYEDEYKNLWINQPEPVKKLTARFPKTLFKFYSDGVTMNVSRTHDLSRDDLKFLMNSPEWKLVKVGKQWAPYAPDVIFIFEPMEFKTKKGELVKPEIGVKP